MNEEINKNTYDSHECDEFLFFFFTVSAERQLRNPHRLLSFAKQIRVHVCMPSGLRRPQVRCCLLHIAHHTKIRSLSMDNCHIRFACMYRFVAVEIFVTSSFLFFFYFIHIEFRWIDESSFAHFSSLIVVGYTLCISSPVFFFSFLT